MPSYFTLISRRIWIFLWRSLLLLCFLQTYIVDKIFCCLIDHIFWLDIFASNVINHARQKHQRIHIRNTGNVDKKLWEYLSSSYLQISTQPRGHKTQVVCREKEYPKRLISERDLPLRHKQDVSKYITLLSKILVILVKNWGIYLNTLLDSDFHDGSRVQFYTSFSPALRFSMVILSKLYD